MLELAFDAQGHPIHLPPEAVRFLVRRHRPKVAPQPVRRNGALVTVPIDASLAEFRHIINDEPGRYRLLALDEAGAPISDVPEALVEIDSEPDTFASAPQPPQPAPDPLAISRAALAQQPTELLLLETMRANTEMTRSMIDRLPDILRASAYLLQAADGAGLPRRRPVWPVDPIDYEDADLDDDGDTGAEGPSGLVDVIKAAITAALGGGGGDLATLAKLVAAGSGDSAAIVPSTPGADASTASTAATPPTPASSPSSGTGPRNAQPRDPKAHLLAILAKLTADERAYAQRVVDQLSPAAIKQWHDLLLSMSVDQAVELIRAKAQGKEA